MLKNMKAQQWFGIIVQDEKMLSDNMGTRMM
jgi:hypothetical protein